MKYQYLFSMKNKKNIFFFFKKLSAAVVIGALRVNISRALWEDQHIPIREHRRSGPEYIYLQSDQGFQCSPFTFS